ncbi:MAG: hypothetical protein KatS3mg111_0289 [Pirellulaceae bacterium]|nr:MAG: hypothetical protein KatS3mg111_0289 [Pirellulaceae bacterium]
MNATAYQRESSFLALSVIAAAVMFSAPANVNRQVVGGQPCTVQDELLSKNCPVAPGRTACSRYRNKCNSATGTKTKLCNENAGGGNCSDGNPNCGEFFHDELSSTACEENYS